MFAEWAEIYPMGSIAFLRQEHPSSAGQVLLEWMRLDPDRAITQMLAGGEQNAAMLLGAMEEIARLAPSRLVEVASKLSTSLRNQPGNAEEAFAILARSNPEAARTAAESITGVMRLTALAGVAKAWAESDPASALAWAQTMPNGEARDSALQAVLTSWAKRDPFS